MATAIDPRLLSRVLDGDDSALNRLIMMLSPIIERQLLRYPVADEDRSDLLQTTLLQVIRKLGSFRGDSNFSTWLFRVTANEALMLMRSHRRHRARVVAGLELEDLATLPASNETSLSVEQDVAARQRDARVRLAMSELSEEYRRVVTLHYHHDLGLEEIAERLDLTESAVRSRLHRARSRLRTILAGAELSLEAA